MAVSQKIKDHAKTLYLSRDKEGKRMYSLRDISKEIEQDFNKKYSHVTIGNWAKDGSWDVILQKAVQYGIQQTSESTLTTEEQIIDKAADDLAEVYKYGMLLCQIGTDVIQRAYRPDKEPHKHISVKEGMMAVRTGAVIMARLNSMLIPEDDDFDYGVVYIPDNGRDRYLDKP
ncbi:hypothetical protein [Draconibacterium sediminis]|uniref:Uncharacterized protein n=1 Tax=Draconibacterium sediminis TaxID=1544798 RepID=A0A0D8JAX4_9BACT|nr:hypothetical protein [Draconibacterium sediminis]KJF44062.1 hypothetical protein LH29_00540 [Draconibacterium sediminis]